MSEAGETPEHEAESDATEARTTGRALRCPFCHDGFTDEQKTDACPKCDALHHRRCIREHGACASCGQRKVPGIRKKKDVRASRAQAYAAQEALLDDPRVKAKVPGLDAKQVRVAGFLELAIAIPMLAFGNPDKWLVNGIPMPYVLWFLIAVGVFALAFPNVLVELNKAHYRRKMRP